MTSGGLELTPEQPGNGYPKDIRPNPKWREQGFICRFEHCIELMPLQAAFGACPIFGHKCPGGEKDVKWCEENEDALREEIGER